MMRSTSRRTYIQALAAKRHAEIRRDGLEAVRERVKADWCRHAAGVLRRRFRVGRRRLTPTDHGRRRIATPRPRERRATRSSAKSGDSPSDSEPPTVEPWRWASPESWRSFVESIESHDVERQIKRERES